MSVSMINQLIAEGSAVLQSRKSSGIRLMYDLVDNISYGKWVMNCLSLLSQEAPDHVQQIKSIYKPGVNTINIAEQIYAIVASAADFLAHKTENTGQPLKAKNEYKWDAFICHASEDKKNVVAPLAELLRNKKMDIWYDEFELKIGDSLLKKIDEGLIGSRYGIVVISPSFFKKQWPQAELDGLFQKELDGKKVILPVWHNVKRSDVAAYSPILAGKIAGTTERGLKSLSDELEIAILNSGGQKDTKQTPPDDILLSCDYKRVVISQYLHKYSLLCSIFLNYPPSINGFKLKIYWPECIRITKAERLKIGRKQKINSIQYVEYVYEETNKLYPGDSMEIISPSGRAEIEYEFDNNIWSLVEENEILLIWEILLPDRMPIKGEINFRKLNIF